MTRVVWLWAGIAIVGLHACSTKDGHVLSTKPRPDETGGIGGAVVSTVEATTTTRGSGGAGGYIPITVTTSVTTEPPPPTYCDDTISPCICEPNGGICTCATTMPMGQCQMSCPPMFYCDMECIQDSMCILESDGGVGVTCWEGSSCTVYSYSGMGTVVCYPFSSCVVYAFAEPAYIWCDVGAFCDCPTQNCICEGQGCPMP